MTYFEKLKDPRWQKKRLEILQRDNFTCRNCGDEISTLHVHHCGYIKSRDPWEYNDSLITLCEECHAEREQLENRLTVNCQRVSNRGLAKIVELLAILTDLPDKSDIQTREMD